MSVSQKCQYALRAIFELGRRQGQLATIADVAAAQDIPPRFLETILVQLKQGGFVESRRGVQGGYTLAKKPSEISAASIIEFIDGPIAPVRCLFKPADETCQLFGQCVFIGLWERARAALANVYENTTIQDLLGEDQALAYSRSQDYCI